MLNEKMAQSETCMADGVKDSLGATAYRFHYPCQNPKELAEDLWKTEPLMEYVESYFDTPDYALMRHKTVLIRRLGTWVLKEECQYTEKGLSFTLFQVDSIQEAVLILPQKVRQCVGDQHLKAFCSLQIDRYQGPHDSWYDIAMLLMKDQTLEAHRSCYVVESSSHTINNQQQHAPSKLVSFVDNWVPEPPLQELNSLFLQHAIQKDGIFRIKVI